MHGFQELIIKLTPIIFGVGIVVAGIARLRKKLSAESQPTFGTYVNELGGYVLAAIIALILGVYMLFFDPGSQPPNTGDTSTPVQVSPGTWICQSPLDSGQLGPCLQISSRKGLFSRPGPNRGTTNVG